MRSRLRLTLWLVFGIALLGVPTMARAQVEPVDSTGVPRIQTPQVFMDNLEGVASSARNQHDGLFRATSTAYLILASTDLSVSMYQIGRGGAREGGFGAQWQDSPVAFALTKSAMAAAFAYGLQGMHKKRPKTALVLSIAAAAVEGWLTVHAANIPQLPR